MSPRLDLPYTLLVKTHTLDIRYSSMRTIGAAAAFGLTIFASATALGQETAKNLQIVSTTPSLVASNATIGRNLELGSSIAFHPAAPAGGVSVTITSNNPSQLLLSASPNGPGSASIVLKVRESLTLSPEFYIYALASSGSATYTATAPGFSPGSGTVTMAPSGFMMTAKSRTGASMLMTTTKAKSTTVTIGSVMLDSSLNYVGQQSVAGGRKVEVKLNSSNPGVGRITESPVTIEAGYNTATTQFQPVAPGTTTLALVMPDGFTTPIQGTTMNATVRMPGIGLADEPTVGENLESAVSFSLGEVAPEGGLEVTLVSSDPSKILLSKSATEVGSGTLKLIVPAGGSNGSLYLQALAKSGTVSYTVSAPGYTSRTGVAHLAASGVVVAGMSFPETGGPADPGFLTSLSSGSDMPLYICTAFLDPVSNRAADVRVQPVRAGYSVTAQLTSSDPKIGTVAPSVTLPGGQAIVITPFKALSVGTAVVSIDIPAGFNKPANATFITAKVGK
jgi:F0F1-type ATP synthase membrane subunit c/vacuolar-type H+-ATPase subunit K